MPRGDRTGPWGQGSKTGRAAGYCTGYQVPGFMNPIPGYGFGRGLRRGRGRGFGRGFGLGRGRGLRHSGFGRFWGYPYPQETPCSTFQPLTEEQEMDILEEQTKLLEDELNQLMKRKMELKKQRQKKKEIK